MLYAKKNSSPIVDFGDPNVQSLTARFSALTKAEQDNQVITITQFGDSHTAADLFTGELRTLLQNRYGNAGIGWITPIAIKGQYHTSVKWNYSNWALLSSQTSGIDPSEFDFPMGGFIAKTLSNKESIQIIPNTLDDHLWQVKVLFRSKNRLSPSFTLYDKNRNKVNLNQNMGQNNWQTVSAQLQMPLRIENKAAIELGGIWLTHSKPNGVVVSAIAANGAKQSIWQKWSEQWFDELAASQTDLVILAYGANESFDKTLDLIEYKLNLISNIRNIRQTLPHAVILLISPPDTMVDDKHAPLLFASIQKIQQQVAKSEKTLLWDWQQAMGGKFIIKQWLREGLAKPDLVHQTSKGYKTSAKIFYSDFIEFIEKR